MSNLTFIKAEEFIGNRIIAAFAKYRGNFENKLFPKTQKHLSQTKLRSQSPALLSVAKGQSQGF